MDVKLTDAGMELIRASDAFRELDPQVCADLETHLYHAFPAGYQIHTFWLIFCPIFLAS